MKGKYDEYLNRWEYSTCSSAQIFEMMRDGWEAYGSDPDIIPDSIGGLHLFIRRLK